MLALFEVAYLDKVEAELVNAIKGLEPSETHYDDQGDGPEAELVRELRGLMQPLAERIREVRDQQPSLQEVNAKMMRVGQAIAEHKGGDGKDCLVRRLDDLERTKAALNRRPLVKGQERYVDPETVGKAA